MGNGSISAVELYSPPAFDDASPVVEKTKQAASLEAMEAVYDEARSQGYEAGLKQGADAGFKEGYEKGVSQGKIDIQAKLDALNQIIESSRAPLDELDVEAEREIIEFVMSLSKKVAMSETLSRPDLIADVVRAGVRSLPSSERNITIRLHPEDVDLLKSEDPPASWNLYAEETLSRGDCIIDTDNSHIDLTIDARVKRIFSTVFGSKQ